MIEAINIPGYRIVRELGRGAMATVYLAIQEKFEREVALKVMSPLLDRDPSFAVRFEREARIVAQMSHSSIVHVIDVGHHDGYHYLVMEYLPGGDLKARIQAGEHGLSFALKVCVAIASALESAHSKKIVHRDVKPANILFRQDATPVLTDFGIARPMDSRSQLTMVGTLVGTLDYISPEQANGTDLDGRSDLYSLGAVFYEVLTGSVPYQADSSVALITKQANDPPPLLPAQFAMFQPFVDQIMAKERDNRHATGGEVIRVLRMAAEMANARRADGTLKPVPPLHAAAECLPTVVALRAAPSSAMGSEAIATTQVPATEMRPSAVMPIPSQALAMATATGAEVMQDAEASGAGAPTLISVRPASHSGATPASPAPGTRPAPASATQNFQVGSVIAQFVRAPVRIAIAAGICIAVIGGYLLVATRDGASERAGVIPEKAQTPKDRSLPPQQLGKDASPGEPTLRVPDAAASTPSMGPIEESMEPKEEQVKEQWAEPRRPPEQQTSSQKAPSQKAPGSNSPGSNSKAETQKLADEQAKRNLEVERKRKEAEILPLLSDAKRFMALGHLWQPPGNSAADRYLAIEKIDSNNAEAQSGLARVFDAIIQEARNEAASGDWVATNGLIQKLRVLRPDHAELLDLEALLERPATAGPMVNSASKAKRQRADRFIKGANSKLDRVPLTHALLDGAWKEFKLAEQAAPLAPGLSQLRARFPESLAIAAKIEFDRGNTTGLQRLVQLAKSNGWEYVDPAQPSQTASDQ